MRRRATDLEIDALWERFHQVVNMPSSQLRSFLLADAAGADGAFPDQPDLGVDPEGRRVLEVLAKRKTDLTGDDLELMERVVEEISNLLAAGALTGVDDPLWRRDLMTLGHDPMRDRPPKRLPAGHLPAGHLPADQGQRHIV